jgi:hypothetical protein
MQANGANVWYDGMLGCSTAGSTTVQNKVQLMPGGGSPCCHHLAVVNVKHKLKLKLASPTLASESQAVGCNRSDIAAVNVPSMCLASTASVCHASGCHLLKCCGH